jgi:hypothetical protein
MLSNDQLGVKLGHSAMSAQCPHCPKADVDPRIVMSQKCHQRLLAAYAVRYPLAKGYMHYQLTLGGMTGNVPLACRILR